MAYSASIVWLVLSALCCLCFAASTASSAELYFNPRAADDPQAVADLSRFEMDKLPPGTYQRIYLNNGYSVMSLADSERGLFLHWRAQLASMGLVWLLSPV